MTVSERQVPELTISDECKWCAEGEPEWSPHAKCWIHRRSSVDKRCLRRVIGPIGEPLLPVQQSVAEPSRGAPEAAHYAVDDGYCSCGVFCETGTRFTKHLQDVSQRAPLLEPGENCVYDELRRIYCCHGAEFSRPTLEKAWKEIAKFRSGHVVLLEALRHALPILIGAIAFVDCKAVVAEVRAAIKQAERT